VSTELVSRIERGVCLPSVPTLVAFATVLEVTPNELLGFDDDAPEGAKLLGSYRRLPKARRKELEHLAEALARYERRR
jgi:transcriptional regulator with XRE-family HTH domain